MISKKLLNTIKNIYAPLNLQVTILPVVGKYNREYEAVDLGINNLNIAYREAKITPKKNGQFVAVWKKMNTVNTPYDSTDKIDRLIINVSENNHLGQFIFDKKILIKKGIFSHEDKIGKMAFRLYPPWTSPASKQAMKTQEWQMKYYVSLSDINEYNALKLKELLKNEHNNE